MPERDRRRHRIYVTRNTEYHVRDGFCVAVRDRRSGEFLRGHLARGRRVQGGLRFLPGSIVPHVGEPETGDCLYFSADGRDLVTSSLLEVGRPSKELTQAYPETAFSLDGSATGASEEAQELAQVG